MLARSDTDRCCVRPVRPSVDEEALIGSLARPSFYSYTNRASFITTYKLQVINPSKTWSLLTTSMYTLARKLRKIDSQAKQTEHRACQGGIQRVNRANVEGSTGEGVIH